MPNQTYIDESRVSTLLARPQHSVPEPIDFPNQPQAVYDSAYLQKITVCVWTLRHIEASRIIGSILQKIDESVTDPEMYDDNEAHPTEDVVRGIKELVQATEAFLLGERLPTVIVRPLDRSIRITWVKESGNVRLVYSEKPVDRYIFHEEVLGGRSYNSGVERDPTPRSLASWLKWLNSR